VIGCAFPCHHPSSILYPRVYSFVILSAPFVSFVVSCDWISGIRTSECSPADQRMKKPRPRPGLRFLIPILGGDQCFLVVERFLCETLDDGLCFAVLWTAVWVIL